MIRGDQPDAHRGIYFFDTAVMTDLGDDQVTRFGARDLIVTTSALGPVQCQ